MATVMFKIKICGITNLEDANAAFESGADAIGLNFYPQSSRFVSHLDANFICQDLKVDLQKVGVFVNASKEEIESTAEHLRLDFVQLQGDESIEFVSSLRGLKVIRAIRLPDAAETNESCAIEQLSQIASDYANKCPNLSAVLLDSFDPENYGGTGKTIDWSSLDSLDLAVSLILAGGLNPENVENAIELVNPDAVDVASGVEKQPGIKDRELMEGFGRNALTAFSRKDQA